jgi:2'-5' RNA ligase
MTGESAIDLRLPERSELLDRWRLATVADAALGMPPHITLLYPWRPAPVRTADLAEVAVAVGGMPLFTVTLRRLARFTGVLYVAPEPEGVVRRLAWRLATAFPDTPPYGGQFVDPIPHLTVARAPTEGGLDDLQAEVSRELVAHLPIAFTVSAVAVDAVGDDGRWRLRSLVALAGNDTGRHSVTTSRAEGKTSHA